jgi:hypothetical protein
MYPESNVRQPSVWGLIRTVLVFIVITVYAVITLNTRDLLWFWPKFENQPDRILVHCYGEDVEITTASQNFDPMTDIINRTLSGEKRWDPLSLSQATYDEYRTNPGMLTLEVYFPDAVRIHTQTAFFSNVDILVIPLDARHSTYNTLFGRTQDGNQAAGSLHVDSLDDLRAYLYTHGICHPSSEVQSDQQPGVED